MSATGSEGLQDRVARVLAEEVAPILQLDATDIEVLDVSDGVVRVRFHGACAACPGAIMTLIMGVEQELRQRFPEVEYLEAVA
jgi:Fe-S cluster biogenesis protein NfuA